MSAYSPEFTVTDLAGLAPRWDKLIAADLVGEVENDTAERVETIDEMRLFLAIKGYRQIFDLLKAEGAGKDRHRGVEGHGAGVPRLREREARPVSRDLPMPHDREPGMGGRFYGRTPIVREAVFLVRSGRRGLRARDQDTSEPRPGLRHKRDVRFCCRIGGLRRVLRLRHGCLPWRSDHIAEEAELRE
jgi:hypothetical protein